MPRVRFGRAVAPHERLPVAWYQPDVLLKAARDMFSSLDQLRNRDVREGFTLPMAVIDRSQLDAAGEFWFDFIADTGDGGNATYAVAHTALADGVHDAAGETLPRGELLLFGGDLAYPSASSDDYRRRFIEVFEGARRDKGAAQVRGRPFTVAAIAQNHDWMDSAATFNRYFIRHNTTSSFLGAAIPQKQSYFCVKLPQGWWALGLDFALIHDIDRDQYEQFEKLLSESGLQSTVDGVTTTHKIAPGDRVILIYPEPYWTRPIGDGAEPSWPKRYQRLEGLLRERVELRLAGDLHHYMRWSSDKDGQLVTCGSGGAFAHPTHTHTTTRPILLRCFGNDDALPAEPGPAIVIGHDDGDRSRPSTRYERVEASAYPDAASSRRMARGNVTAFFKRGASGWGGNWLFAVLLGVLYWFNAYLNSLPFSDSFAPDGFAPMWKFAPSDYFMVFLLWLKAMIFSPLGFVINLVMAGVCVVMGREAVDELSPQSSRLRRWAVTWGFGAVHAFAHVVAVFSLEFGLQQAVGSLPVIGHPQSALAAIGHALAVGLGMLVAGGIVGALIFGCYLAFMSARGYLTNNGYSALGIEDFKGFLRFRVTEGGRLDAFFVAIPRVPRQWSASPGHAAPAWEPQAGGAPTARVHDRFSIQR